MNNENLTLHFKVKDFNAWQTSYNGNEKNRTSAGITKSKVFRSADDHRKRDGAWRVACAGPGLWAGATKTAPHKFHCLAFTISAKEKVAIRKQL